MRDAKLAGTLLDMITRPSTNEGELLNAARQLGKMAERAGGVQKLFSFSVTPPPAMPLSFNETRRAQSAMEMENQRLAENVRHLEKKVSDLLASNAALEAENVGLKRSLRDRNTSKNGSTMPFSEFAHKARTILGVVGWRQEFVRQTGIDPNAFDRAARDGVASDELLNLLTQVKSAKTPLFSIPEVQQIRKWSAKHNDDELAQLATKNFQRIITPNAIKKLRTDLRNRNGVFADKAYGGPLPSDKKNTPFPWSAFPTQEKLVCDNSLKRDRKSSAAMAELVSKNTGRKVNDGQIKQRCDNASPPDYMVAEITGTGPITWPELWYLGAKLSKRAWKQEVFSYLGTPAISPGDPLDHIDQQAVEDLRNHVRRLKRGL